MLNAYPLERFVRGVDLLSSPNEVKQGFAPNANNFGITEYGGAEKVLGYSAFATIANPVHRLFSYEQSSGTYKRLIAATSNAWYSIDGAGSPTTIRSILTSPPLQTSTTASFATLGDTLYGMDDASDLASWNGSSLVGFAPGVSTGPPRGRILGIWNGRMIVQPAADPTQIVWSERYNFASWPVDNYANVPMPGTGNRIMGLRVLQDGCALFTSTSVIWIYEMGAGGAFQSFVAEPRIGCVSGDSITTHGGMLYYLGRNGVHMTDGKSPALLVSKFVDPLFLQGAPLLTDGCSVSFRNKVLQSFGRGLSGVTRNDITLEFYPGFEHAIMPNEYPMHRAVVSSLLNDIDNLFFVDAADKTKIRRGYYGGSFNGLPIGCLFETAPANLGSEQFLKRLYETRVVGRGELLMAVRTDYSQSTQPGSVVGHPSAVSGSWDVMNWDQGYWGGYDLHETFLRTTHRARQFGFVFTESSINTFDGRSQLGGPGGVVGGAAVFLVEPRYKVTRRGK